MDNRLLSEQHRVCSAELADNMLPRRSERRWLVVLWVFSLLIGTTGWWAGLAWAAIWLVARAVS
jgi:hypothetical protein